MPTTETKETSITDGWIIMFIYYFKNISNMQETMSTLVLKKRHHINFFLSAKKKKKKNERRETEHTKDIF